MLGSVVTVILIGGAALLAVPVVTFGLECALGAAGKAGRQRRVRPEGKTAVVVMPAHDEEQGIARTLSALRGELGEGDSVLVVADNCSDRTAEIARKAGATVLERVNAEERGKGYALDYAVQFLASRTSMPDVVIVLDADCQFLPGSVDALVSTALWRDSPIQSEYELVAGPDADSKKRIGAFAFRVRNTLRTRGLSRLGLPRHLAGTGMAFPWAVLYSAPNMRGHITEDLVMGLELALLGKPTYDCPNAAVRSDMAPTTEGQRTQRKRWETGHLSAIREYLPKLFVSSLTQRRGALLAMACDLAVPPLSLLVVSVVGTTAVAALAPLFGGSWLPAALFGGESAILVASVAVAWCAVGRDLLPGRELLAIPKYLLWKLPGYLGILGRDGSAGWVRAERPDRSPPR